MPKPIKLLIGAASALPMLIVVYVLVRVMQAFSEVAAAGGSVDPNRVKSVVHELLTVNTVTGLLILVLLGFYLWHVLVRRARRDPTAQVIWALALVLLPIFAMPAYWFVHVWPEASPESGPQRA